MVCLVCDCPLLSYLYTLTTPPLSHMHKDVHTHTHMCKPKIISAFNVSNLCDENVNYKLSVF